MATNNLENNINNSSSTSTINDTSQSSTLTTPSSNRCINYSSINRTVTSETRRNVRLSTKCAKTTSLSSNGSNFHRTISGGVDNSHSLKLKLRKRLSGSTDTADPLASSITYLTTISHNADANQVSNNNNSIFCQDLLPPDQSDDDEMITNNNERVQQELPKLVTRSEILSYFIIHGDGYKHKLCNKVSVPF